MRIPSKAGLARALIGQWRQPAAGPRRERDFARWGEPLAFPDLGAFEAGFAGQSQPFSIDLGGLPFDGMFRRGTGGTLFVYFAAAAAHRPDRKLPIFNWVGQSRLCTGSALFLADPVLLLSQELTLGWYLGTSRQPLQEVLVRVVAAARRAAGAARIAFVGSSGGGFPALWLTERFPGSAAFVNAPTTTIRGHHARIAVQRFCDVALDGAPLAGFPGILELPARPAAETGARFVITQSRGDAEFAGHHVTPFLRSMGLDWTGADVLADNLLLRVGEPERWGKGHVMPPREVTREVLWALDRVEGAGFSGLDLPALHRRICEADPLPGGA